MEKIKHKILGLILLCGAPAFCFSHNLGHDACFGADCNFDATPWHITAYVIMGLIIVFGKISIKKDEEKINEYLKEARKKERDAASHSKDSPTNTF